MQGTLSPLATAVLGGLAVVFAAGADYESVCFATVLTTLTPGG